MNGNVFIYGVIILYTVNSLLPDLLCTENNYTPAILIKLLLVWGVGSVILGQVKSKTEILTPVTFLVNVHLLRATAGMFSPMSV